MSAKKPVPRSRKPAGGDTPFVPPGFTIGRYTDAKGEEQTGWRCPEITQNPATREWRRCSKFLQKRDCAAHLRSGKHEFNIPRGQDDGFPADFGQRREQLGLQRGFDRIYDAMAQFAGRANIPVREASRRPMLDFVHEIGAVAIQLHASAPTFRASSIPPISATSLTRRLREQGQAAFDDIIGKISREIHYVNILTDAGTVLRFNTVHAMIVNPNYPNTVLPLDTYENRRFTGDDYEVFFLNAIDELRRLHVEPVAIVCDNCPAQVNGVAQALALRADMGILHIPCFNHMINLVFTEVLAHKLVSPRMTDLNDVIKSLLSEEGRNVLGRRCPTLVRTRWVYAVDVLRFVLKHLDDVNTVLAIQECPPLAAKVEAAFKTLYWILLPLELFSLSMESRTRALREVVPLLQEVVREYQAICERLTEQADIAIVDHLTAHLMARLRINAFEETVAAWALSIDGRDRLRRQESHFLDRTGCRYRRDIAPLACVTEMRERFRAELEPWKQSTDAAQGEDGITIDDFVAQVRAPRPAEGDVITTPPEEVSPARATAVARQRDLFKSNLRTQMALKLSHRLAAPLAEGAAVVAHHRVSEMARALGLDPIQAGANYFDWIFKNEVPDEPTDTDMHWRHVHAMGARWHDLARIGVRYASIATSEADVERLIGEQQDIQGLHGVNFGTRTLNARLVLRYEGRQ